LACTGAAVLAFACGGDDLQKEVSEYREPVRTEYVGGAGEGDGEDCACEGYPDVGPGDDFVGDDDFIG
jgi:hypothetical protein